MMVKTDHSGQYMLTQILITVGLPSGFLLTDTLHIFRYPTCQIIHFSKTDPISFKF